MNLDGLRNKLDPARGIAVDTSLVVFFLGLEIGRIFQSITFDAFLLFVAMLTVIVSPYFLPSDAAKPAFAKWLTGRSLIAVLAIGIGVVLNLSLGPVLPESFRFLPLTLLILASMTSCFIRFYALMRLRLAK